MKRRSLILFLSLLVPTLQGCQKDNRVVLLRNYAYITHQNVNATNRYLDATYEDILDLIDLKIPFIVYLTLDGCSGCEKFSPIMNEWAHNEAHLIVKLENENALTINTQLNDLFSTTVADGSKKLKFPTVGVVNSLTSFDAVNNSKYMKTRMAFFNHMNNKYKTSDIYFSSSVNRPNLGVEYTSLLFNNKDNNSKSIYSTKVLPLITQSTKRVLISNKEASDLKLSFMKVNSQNKNYLDDEITVTSETSQDSLNKYFI